ncbi:heavy metal-associated isoprenylated plant protein 32-like isoform X1 [Zingiber officinale]|uniref:heavy metal-associated isoprenylated plant protein 32-like isoform X1 n=2 Tax=Zingiber officinale TaxID=94328 RepID=UPI001C4D269D|nr:heavy metal-associated isoprenylated plant protein 32-like isoform X1 [Zingiber officinale]
MSREGDSLKLLKTQACVMRVNICCDGCQKKVKKVLLKTDGVQDVSISVEERKVTVTGSVEPDVLVKKLNKAGKHAELLSVKGGGGGGGKGQSLTGLLQKLQLEHQIKENGKAQKEGGGGGGKEQKGPPVAETQQEGKGYKDFKFPSFKDLKIPFKKDNGKAAAKLDPSPKEELDDGSDFDDEFDDFEDEDEDDEELSDLDEYSDDEPMMKPKAKDKGGEKGINGGGKIAGGGNNNNKGGNINSNSHAHNGGPSSNKGGGSNKDKGGGLPIGQPHMMGQFGNMQPPMGLMGSNNAQGPPAGAYLPSETMAGGANPYQQQYLQALMQQQQQQRMMMNGLDRPAFQPMGYGYGPQPMYAPQPHPYTVFSDENPNGCSIM